MSKLVLIDIDKESFLKRCSKSNPWLVEDSSYHVSYKRFIKYLAKKADLTEEKLISAAGMAYSWMPTTINIQKELIPGSYSAVKRLVEDSDSVTDKDIKKASEFLSGSVVGISKVLHFLDPENFPIYDTGIYCFIYRKSNRPSYSTVNRARRYVRYCENVRSLSKDKEVQKLVKKDVVDGIKHKYNYDFNISYIRAIEVAMFARSPIRDAST